MKRRARATAARAMCSDVLPGLAQLLREVHVAAVHEDVDARAAGAFQRLAGRVDVAGDRAGQRADRRVLHLARDRRDGLAARRPRRPESPLR